jgi:hypothetical protein
MPQPDTSGKLTTMASTHRSIPKHIATWTISASCLAVVGCGGESPLLAPITLPGAAETTTTTTTRAATSTVAAPAPFDYRNLLLRPEDMARPNNGYSVPQEAAMNPDGITGAEVLITSDDSTNAVGITIVVLPDASTAAEQLPLAISQLSTVAATDPAMPAPFGDGAVTVAGTTPDGTKSAVALMFRQERAIVRIDYYSLLGQPTPMDVVIDIGQKQNAALRAGLSAIDAPS